MMSLQYYTYHSIHRVRSRVLVVVFTTIYVYNIIDAVPGIYMYYDTRMGRACIGVIGTTGVHELTDCLLYFISIAVSSTEPPRTHQLGNPR